MHPLLQKQNETEFVNLLKASAYAYRKAKTKEYMITAFLILLAIGYPFAYIITRSETFKLWLFGGSFVITLLTWFLADYFKGNTTKGALLKEEFDTKLFGLPWRFLLQKVNPVEVLELAGKYKKGNIENWYPANLSEKVPHNIAVAVCQRISSSWDKMLRSRFNTTLYVVLGCYMLAVFVLWLTNSVDLKTVFLLYFSTLSFHGHIISLIRGNNNAIKKRTQVEDKLDYYIQNNKPLGTEDLRDVQDELYTIRQEPSKIPDWFCRIHYKKINAIQEKYVEERVNSLY